MKPTKPCSECGHHKFAYVNELSFEILSDRQKSWGNVHNPTFSACICLQCRHTKFFGLPARPLDDMKYEFIEVPGTHPYR